MREKQKIAKSAECSRSGVEKERDAEKTNKLVYIQTNTVKQTLHKGTTKIQDNQDSSRIKASLRESRKCNPREQEQKDQSRFCQMRLPEIKSE